MDYQVSARKWRPQDFSEVIGQQHVAQTLTNAIRQGRIAHAYLFSGSRGVGKTTMARILAKALNCQSGPTADPCQSCPACQDITAGHSPDVVEIDGASNRGIDEVRELREAVKYSPMQGQYRVFIIDEVHMLTKEAFNALLKTLEEPPAHVVFILATTEVHKIPSTILSRCQYFQFRRMTRQEIMSNLSEVARKEGLTLSASGASVLARAADGSMRDALSLLDQAAAYSGKEVSEEDLQAMLGAPPREISIAMVAALVKRQTAAALTLVQTILDQGYDLRQFTSELVEHLRNLLVAKLAKDPAALMDLPKEEVEALCQTAASVTEEELQRLFGIVAQALEALRTATHPRFTVEMAMIKATQLPPLQSVEQLLDRLEKVEKGLSSVEPTTTSNHSIAGPEPVSPESHLQWEDVIQRIQKEKPSLSSYLEQGTLVNFMNDAISLSYPANADFLVDLIQKEEHQQIIKGTLKELFGHSVKFSLIRLEQKPVSPKESPKESQDPLKRNKIRKETLAHPLVQEALNIFGGEIIDIQEP